MITSFFNKSKPINYIIIFLLALLGFVIAVFKYNTSAFNTFNSLKLLFNFGLTYLSIFALNFIVKRNNLTQDNTFAVLIYCLGLLLFPQAFLNVKIIISNLFIILALRRLLSLSSQKNTLSKLFDFGVLIALAFLFNKWAISVFFIGLVALFYYPERRFNHFVLPFIGALFVSTLTYTVYLYAPEVLFYTDLVFYFKWLTFTSYTWQVNLAIAVFVFFALFALLFYIPSIKHKKRIKQPAFYLVIIAFFTLMFVAVVQPLKTVSELLFVFMPLSIIVSNALENRRLKLANEFFLIICFISIATITFV